PMRDLVSRAVKVGPGLDGSFERVRQIFKCDGCLAAMLASEPGFQDVARQEGQQRRAATTRFQIIGGRSGHALEPNLPVMAELRCEPIRADERVREAPAFARKLPERLTHPTRQSEVIKA